MYNGFWSGLLLLFSATTKSHISANADFENAIHVGFNGEQSASKLAFEICGFNSAAVGIKLFSG